jgi:hypothetical protein
MTEQPAEAPTELVRQEDGESFSLPALIVRAADQVGVDRWVAFQAFKNRFAGAPIEMVAAALHKAASYQLDVLEDLDVFQPKANEPWQVAIKVDGRKKLAKRNPLFRAYTTTDPELRKTGETQEWWVHCTVYFWDGRPEYRTFGRCGLKGQRGERSGGGSYDIAWAPEIARARAIRNALRDCFPETAQDPALELAYERWEAVRTGLFSPERDQLAAGEPVAEGAPAAPPEPDQPSDEAGAPDFSPPGPGAGEPVPAETPPGRPQPAPQQGTETGTASPGVPQKAAPGEAVQATLEGTIAPPVPGPDADPELERRMDIVRRVEELARFAFRDDEHRRRWFRDAFRLLKVSGYGELSEAQLSELAAILQDLAAEKGSR